MHTLWKSAFEVANQTFSGKPDSENEGLCLLHYLVLISTSMSERRFVSLAYNAHRLKDAATGSNNQCSITHLQPKIHDL